MSRAVGSGDDDDDDAGGKRNKSVFTIFKSEEWKASFSHSAHLRTTTLTTTTYHSTAFASTARPALLA